MFNVIDDEIDHRWTSRRPLLGVHTPLDFLRQLNFFARWMQRMFAIEKLL